MDLSFLDLNFMGIDFFKLIVAVLIMALIYRYWYRDTWRTALVVGLQFALAIVIVECLFSKISGYLPPIISDLSETIGQDLSIAVVFLIIRILVNGFLGYGWIFSVPAYAEILIVAFLCSIISDQLHSALFGLQYDDKKAESVDRKKKNKKKSKKEIDRALAAPDSIGGQQQRDVINGQGPTIQI